MRAVARDVRLGLACAGLYLFGLERADLMLREDAPFVARSFLAAPLCLPVLALVRLVDWRTGPHPAVLWHAALVSLLMFVAGWAGFLLLCRSVLGATGLGAAWPRVVAAWNWCSLAQYGVLALVNLLSLARPGGFVLQVALIVTVTWQGWIEFHALRPLLLRQASTRRGGLVGGLTGAGGLALALTALDFLVGLVVQATTVSLGG